MTTTFSMRPMSHSPECTAEPVQQHSSDPRLAAVAHRDRAWDGAFVYGVTSTRIFCRPSCPSRRPRPDRIRFFEAAADAETAGFRACRRCRPKDLETRDAITIAIARALRLIDDAADPVTLDELSAAVGVSRAHLQREFTRLVGCSPHEWQTARRAAAMRTALLSGQTVSEAAFDAGFGSLPSAYAAADRHFAMSPSALRRGAPGELVHYTIIDSALGYVLVASTPHGICRVTLGDDASALEAEFAREFHAATRVRDDVTLAAAAKTIVDAARGAAIVASLPLDLRGTAFQQRVWRELANIPRGQTATYADIASRIGAPNATRAVGTACGANPVALAVPCHRVLRGDGALGGYRWGVERKRKLLDSESETGRGGT